MTYYGEAPVVVRVTMQQEYLCSEQATQQQ